MSRKTIHFFKAEDFEEASKRIKTGLNEVAMSIIGQYKHALAKDLFRNVFENLDETKKITKGSYVKNSKGLVGRVTGVSSDGSSADVKWNNTGRTSSWDVEALTLIEELDEGTKWYPGFDESEPTILSGKLKGKPFKKKFPNFSKAEDWWDDNPDAKVEVVQNEEIITFNEDQDTVTVNIPLLIRLLEYAKEDAKDDMALHRVAERLVELNKSELTMDDYNKIVREENLDELSGATMVRYFKKAGENQAHHQQSADYHKTGLEAQKHAQKARKRADGRNAALNRLSQKEDKEVQENLDELSKDTLNSYKKKANDELSNGNFYQQNYKPIGSKGDKISNRIKGISQAHKKMKEDQQIDEISREKATNYMSAAARDVENSTDKARIKKRFDGARLAFRKKHGGNVKVPTSEENLDELSNDLMKKYIEKAADQIDDQEDIEDFFYSLAAKETDPEKKKALIAKGKEYVRKHRNRKDGITNAKSKMKPEKKKSWWSK